MIIRREQLQTFREALVIDVEKELVGHCLQFAPGLYHAAKESGIREAVRFGIQRAKSYRFEDMTQVRFYIDMMLVLGSAFDSDPQFPWAREVLQDSFSKSQVRAMVLHRDLSLYLDEVLGPQKKHVVDALDRFASLSRELPLPSQRNVYNLRDWLDRFFPQKSGNLDDRQLAQIAAAATQQSNEYQLPMGEGILAGVMLVFGHAATYDPLYPWISNVLRDRQITSPEGRLQRLWTKLQVYAESTRKHLEVNS